MKRWLIWLCLPLMSAILLVVNHARSASLLQDTDTAVLLAAIRSRGNALSWFGGDWPLQNHFYRPISTLSFELDNWLYKDNAAGYGLTNALIAGTCILLLFWVLREITDSPWFAGISASIFALWHFSSMNMSWASLVCWVLSVVCLLGCFRKNAVYAILVSTSLVFVGGILHPNEDFAWRIVSWLPGRTASIVTLFSFLSVGSYCRWVRMTCVEKKKEPTSVDLPATRGTQVITGSKHSWAWLVAAVGCLILALGSYEQAVMLPALLTIAYCYYSWSGKRTSMWPICVFWAVLTAYLILRFNILPHGMSGYQEQQTRTGPGVLLSLSDYALPAFNWVRILANMLPGAWILLLTAQPLQLLALSVGNFASWLQVRQSRLGLQVTTTFCLSLFAFLPMAWLMPFGHYHYLPGAFWAAYCCGLLAICMKGVLIAISPREVQAPKRHNPAPGSLLRQ